MSSITLLLTLFLFTPVQVRPDAAAVPELIQALKNADPFTREQAARSLAAIGPKAKEAEVQLTRAVQDRDSQVRRAAAQALAAIGATSEDALEALRRTHG